MTTDSRASESEQAGIRDRREAAARLARRLGLEPAAMHRAAEAAWSNLNPQSVLYERALSVAAAALQAAAGTDGPAREIVRRFPVQPGLNIAVEDSGCIVLELTAPDGSEVIARSGALSDCDNLTGAVGDARAWVTQDEQAARFERTRHVLTAGRPRPDGLVPDDQ